MDKMLQCMGKFKKTVKFHLSARNCKQLLKMMSTVPLNMPHRDIGAQVHTIRLGSLRATPTTWKKTIAILRDTPALQNLAINNNTLNTDTFRQLCACIRDTNSLHTSLKKIDFSSCVIQPHKALMLTTAISKTSNVQQLRLANCHMQELSVAGFCENTSTLSMLELLDLSGNMITDDTPLSVHDFLIRNQKTLLDARIAFCAMQNAAPIVHGLSSCAHLTHVDLSSNGIEYSDKNMDAIHALARAIPEKLPSLTSLDLRHNVMKHAGIACLWEAMSKQQKQRQTVRLYADDNYISAPSDKTQHPHITDAISAMAHKVSHLHIGSNKIGQKTLQDIARALIPSSAPPAIRSLCINGTFEDTVHPKPFLTNLLATSPALGTLNLAANDIGPLTAESITTALLHSRAPITRLSMAHNPLGHHAVVSLAQMLAKKPTLKELLIANTAAHTPGCTAVLSLFISNPEFSVLDIRSNRAEVQELDIGSTLQAMLQQSATRCACIQMEDNLMERGVTRALRKSFPLTFTPCTYDRSSSWTK